ncbi:MAG TPA: NTP transferase domain-containing protein [archaeon]|nr:NTP transferase domain-containing protein [archaeon]
MPIGAIIQARMGSQRLPGKVMCLVAGKPLMSYLIERLEKCRNLDQIVIATSVDKRDQAVAEYCNKTGLACYRGPHLNVARRFKEVLDKYRFDAFVRLSADSPLLDQRLVDKAVEIYREGDYDLVTNILQRTFPRGQSVEVIRSETYLETYPLMQENDDLEHVTRFFYRDPSGFRIYNIQAGQDFKGIHLAVDTFEDLQTFSAILAAMDRPHWEYDLSEIFRLYLSYQKQGRKP